MLDHGRVVEVICVFPSFIGRGHICSRTFPSGHRVHPVCHAGDLHWLLP